MVLESNENLKESNRNESITKISYQSDQQSQLKFISDFDEENTINCVFKNEEFKYKEGGFGWIVLASVTWSYGLIISAMTNYNLIYPNLINLFNETNNKVLYSAWIGSSSIGVSFIMSAPSSILVDLIGSIKTGLVGSLITSCGFIASAFCLELPMPIQFLTYSMLTGIGQALLMTASFSILPHYFDKKIGLVNGLMNAGGSIIQILSSIGMGYMLDNLSLKTTYLIMGGCFFSSFFTSFLYKSQIRRDTKISFKARVKESLGIDILKSRKFLIWSFTAIFGAYGFSIPILTMGHFVTLYYPTKKPEILNIIYGICSGLSSIVFGKLMDKFNLSVAYNYILSYLGYGMATIFLTITTNFYVYCFLIVLISVLDGLFLCSLVPMAIETAGSNLLANQALGYYHAIISVAFVAGPAVSGYLFEIENNYNLAYQLSYAGSFVGTFFLLFYPGIGFSKFFEKFKQYSNF